MMYSSDILSREDRNEHKKVGLKSTSAYLINVNTSVSVLVIRTSFVLFTSPGTDFVPTPSCVSI